MRIFPSRSAALLTSLILIIWCLAACDPEGRKECAWSLEPEPKLMGKTDPGLIPVCARNRKTMKQDCRLQTTFEYAQKVFGRTFRYVDIKWKSPQLPRTIESIIFCDGK